MKINRNNISAKMGVRSLFLTLLLVLLFSVIVGAQNKEDPLTVDIWSDRGGQGIEVLDMGTYNVGEEITFYLYVSTASQVKWTIRDPSGSEDVREETLEAGTHEYLDMAEEQHVGAWNMTLEAWAGGEYAFDVILFTVVGTEPIFPVPVDPCSEIAGFWSWFDGGTVTIRPDGTMGHDPSGNSGMWDCTDPDEGTVIADANGIYFIAPVFLPHGAVVTSCKVLGNAAASAETWYLKKWNITADNFRNMATAAINSADNTIIEPTIDNSDQTLWISTSSLDINDMIKGVIITYTL